MKKNLYSLMLNDEVVHEIDILAHKKGTNRSSLINQILAEYVNYTTPEKRVYEILAAIDQLMQPSRDLVPYFTPNSFSMSLKSSLEYKYRPTVKYDVELYRGWENTIGEISVIFRTQSEFLKEAMTEFFRIWKKTEDKYLNYMNENTAEYILYDGKLVRSLLPPDSECTTEELASAISEYIRIFDDAMKGYLSERYSEKDIESIYYTNIVNLEVHI